MNGGGVYRYRLGNASPRYGDFQRPLDAIFVQMMPSLYPAPRIN